MQNTPHTPPAYLRDLQSLGLILSAGLLLASLIVSIAWYKTHTTTRYVTVKGLAERDVTADTFTWHIRFRLGDSNLHALQKRMKAQRDIVMQFLLQAGFSKEEIIVQPEVEDRSLYGYHDPSNRGARYVARVHMTLLSRKISAIKTTFQDIDTLIDKGLMLRRSNDIRFSFTGLNDIKPSMISEATLNARAAADQFANDSGSKVGSIKTATQGAFSITDTPVPFVKKVRVVTTVQYLLDK